MKSVLFLIYSIRNNNRRHSIENSWMLSLKKYNNIQPMFVYMGEGSGIIDNDLYLKGNESYEQLPLKTYMSLKYCYEHLKFDYIFKCDDDSYIDIDNFLKEINIQMDFGIDYFGAFSESISEKCQNEIKINKQKIHWYKCNDEYRKYLKPIYYNLTYAFGAGYGLSRNFVSHIINTKTMEFFINTPTNYKGEDVAIGLCFDHLKFSKYDFQEKNRDDRHAFVDVWINGLLFHPICELLMLDFYNCKTVDERLNLLYNSKDKSDYIKRNEFLKQYEDLLSK